MNIIINFSLTYFSSIRSDNETSNSNGSSGNPVFDPSGSGQSVIVKLYDHEEGDLSLNDAVEFIGILSMDPNLARAGFEDAEGTAMEHDFVAQVKVQLIQPWWPSGWSSSFVIFKDNNPA